MNFIQELDMVWMKTTDEHKNKLNLVVCSSSHPFQ